MSEENTPNFVFADTNAYVIQPALDPPPLQMNQIKETIIELKKDAKIRVRTQFGHELEIICRNEGISIKNVSKHPCAYKSPTTQKLVLTDSKRRFSLRSLELISGEVEDED